MRKLFLLEDDLSLISGLTFAFKKQGFVLDTAPLANSSLRRVNRVAALQSQCSLQSRQAVFLLPFQFV